MVHVLPHKDFGQEKCEKPPTRYISPDGGSCSVAEHKVNQTQVYKQCLLMFLVRQPFSKSPLSLVSSPMTQIEAYAY